MFITNKKYEELIKSKDEWEIIAKRAVAEAESILKTNEELIEIAKSANDSNKELIKRFKKLGKDLAKRIIADLENIIEVDEEGEAKFDVRELFKIEKKYTESEKDNGIDT